MEEVCSGNQKLLIAALMQGRELANQLKTQLQPSHTIKNHEILMEKIVSSYDSAITLLSYMAILEKGRTSNITENMPESPNLLENSPENEGSDPDYKDQTHKGVSKKRKIAGGSDTVVRLCSGAGHESSLHDGHSWRKYGQKKILGTNHPRAYYRCTHQKTQGCLATKQVQRTDGDPSIFEVVYKGKHSCIQETRKQNIESFATRLKEEGSETGQLTVFGLNPGSGLKLENQELDITEDATSNFPSFSFPSNPVESEDMECPQLFLDLAEDTDIMGSGSYTPPFVSPTTSDSYFSLSQGQRNGLGIKNLSTESDFAEIVSNATTPLAFGDLDIAKFFESFDNCC